MASPKRKQLTLKEQLTKDKKKRWLDIGCGGNFEAGFIQMDTYPADMLPAKKRRNYIRCDILNLLEPVAADLGQFDLVRMQHVFEHFSYEEGRQVLKNCARLLKKDGIILITVPDLRVHIRHYLKDTYKKSGFRWWAHNRIPEDSPNSFYFSIYTHSMPHEQHKWCYDFDGLRYQLESCGEYKNIRQLRAAHPLASSPFTHNRPEEDVCAIAVKS